MVLVQTLGVRVRRAIVAISAPSRDVAPVDIVMKSARLLSRARQSPDAQLAQQARNRTSPVTHLAKHRNSRRSLRRKGIRASPLLPPLCRAMLTLQSIAFSSIPDSGPSFRAPGGDGVVVPTPGGTDLASSHCPSNLALHSRLAVRMDSRAEYYRRRGLELKHRAAQITDLSLKEAHKDVARHWLALAERVDWLDRQHNSQRNPMIKNQ